MIGNYKMEYKRIILFKGAVETLEYFSRTAGTGFCTYGKRNLVLES